MTTLELISIKKNDKYYLRHKKDRYDDFTNLVFNITELPSFSDKWKVFSVLPTQIQRRYPSTQKVICYTLKLGYAVSELTPEKLPLDSFEYLGDDDYKNSQIRGLYDSVCETIPERFEDVQFTIDVIDEDCEPLLQTKYPYVTDFPYFIENHEVVRHKYPCHIESQPLFDIIRNFVKSNLPSHCRITSDYDFHFCVELILPILHEETYQKNVAGFRANKPKYQTAPLRSISFTIISIQIPGNKYSGSTTVESISGSNYTDLETKIDNVLNEYKQMMEQKPIVCPHCKGYGFYIDKKEE